MHIVVFAETNSNADKISRLLSESEIESCDLYVSDWGNQQKITACLGAIRKNFQGDSYIITDKLPVPTWVFELDAKVSVVWKDQDPKDLAMTCGMVEVDLWSDHELEAIQSLSNVSHFLASKEISLNKPCKVKESRLVYGLSDDFFKLELTSTFDSKGKD